MSTCPTCHRALPETTFEAIWSGDIESAGDGPECAPEPTELGDATTPAKEWDLPFTD